MGVSAAWRAGVVAFALCTACSPSGGSSADTAGQPAPKPADKGFALFDDRDPCQKEAGYELETGSGGKGVPIGAINAGRAIKACLDAATRNPGDASALFRLARAYEASYSPGAPDAPDTIAKMFTALQAADKLGYGLATERLALLYRADLPGRPRDVAASDDAYARIQPALRAEYEKGSREAGLALAFALLRDPAYDMTPKVVYGRHLPLAAHAALKAAAEDKNFWPVIFAEYQRYNRAGVCDPPLVKPSIDPATARALRKSPFSPEQQEQIKRNNRGIDTCVYTFLGALNRYAPALLELARRELEDAKGWAKTDWAGFNNNAARGSLMMAEEYAKDAIRLGDKETAAKAQIILDIATGHAADADAAYKLFVTVLTAPDTRNEEQRKADNCSSLELGAALDRAGESTYAFWSGVNGC